MMVIFILRKVKILNIFQFIFLLSNPLSLNIIPILFWLFRNNNGIIYIFHFIRFIEINSPKRFATFF